MSKPFFLGKSVVTKHNIYLRVTNICVALNSRFSSSGLLQWKTFQIRKEDKGDSVMLIFV